MPTSRLIDDLPVIVELFDVLNTERLKNDEEPDEAVDLLPRPLPLVFKLLLLLRKILDEYGSPRDVFRRLK